MPPELDLRGGCDHAERSDAQHSCRHAAQAGGTDAGVERSARRLGPAAREGLERPSTQGPVTQARCRHPRANGHAARAHGAEERERQADARRGDERHRPDVRHVRRCHRVARGGQRPARAHADRRPSAQPLDAAEEQGQHRWLLPVARRGERGAGDDLRCAGGRLGVAWHDRDTGQLRRGGKQRVRYDIDRVVLVWRSPIVVEIDRSRLFNSDQSEFRAKLRADLISPNPTGVVPVTGLLA
jgi:hypothetical protein